jgi:hypothetical protein
VNGAIVTTRTTTSILEHTYVLTPHLVNQVKYGYLRNWVPVVNPTLDVSQFEADSAVGIGNLPVGLKRPKTDTADRDALRRWFEIMAASVPAVERQMKQSSLLAEVEVRAQQLPELATTGLQAISFLSSGSKAPEGWKMGKLAEIEALCASALWTHLPPW